ncbi:MAG: hypothetical protein SGI92_15565 [Bryobacteraceae bacterium]|nr:hypothetical protein [Bryobacteraceae bacterium]
MLRRNAIWIADLETSERAVSDYQKQPAFGRVNKTSLPHHTA